LSVLFAYFLVLVLISVFTARKANNETFFTGNRNSSWYLVAFGMIGASLSGVTFISIPGAVGSGGFTYIQIAIGYIAGYAIVAFVLLPLYYRQNVTSIYSYLGQRFGKITYKTGAGLFIVSKMIGASLRLYLVANVLQKFVFDDWDIPFWATVLLSILLIWIYTFKGGIKTIVWTDTFQTFFMLLCLGACIYLISDELNLALSDIYSSVSEAGYGTVFQTDDPMARNYWWKGIFGGMFVVLGMTGVDQDMMQKNLTCKNQGEAKKNMLTFSVVLFFVNVLFVTMGGLLYLYVDANPEIHAQWLAVSDVPKGDPDLLFPTIALEGGLGITISLCFIIGLIAACYSSADSALAALTTSFAVDFIDIENRPAHQRERIRKWTHVGMSLAMLGTILIFKQFVNESVIDEILTIAGYTYGPLLGLFIFGIITKRRVKDLFCAVICLKVAVLVYFLNTYLMPQFAYKFGPELLGINALLVVLALFIFSSKADKLSGDSGKISAPLQG